MLRARALLPIGGGRPWTTWFVVAFVLLFAGVALWIHARDYLPFFTDDSFISLRYSWRLLHGEGLTWNDGERVEGFSNLLWVVLVALIGVFHGDLIEAARILGFACAALTLLAPLWSGARRDGARGVVVASPAVFLLAATGPFAAWSVGGLEQPLLVCVLAWASVLCTWLCEPGSTPDRRHVSITSWLLGILCLVRPDGLLFTFAALLGVLIARGFSLATLRLGLRLIIGPAALSVALLVFRLAYYDAWVPNTFHAKGGYSWARVLGGYAYVSGTFEPQAALWAILALGTVAAAFSRVARARLAVPLVSAVVWTGYVIRIGGDIFPQKRHLVVTFVLAALVLGELCALCMQHRSRALRGSALAVSLASIAWLVIGQLDDGQRQWAIDNRWHWGGRPVGTMLRSAFARQRPLLAVDAAGALPYYYRLPCLDMLGLNDRYIATHPPKEIGEGPLGHELGAPAYVLARKPDIVAFGSANGDDHPPWRGGRELVALPEWKRNYRAATFQTPDRSRTRARLFVRIHDGRIGIEHSRDRVMIPPYALLSDAELVVRMSRDQRLYARVGPQLLRASGLALAPGVWHLNVDGTGEFGTAVTIGERRVEHGRAGDFRVEPGETHTVAIDIEAPPQRKGRVYRLELTRRQPLP